MTAPRTNAEILADLDHCLRILGGEPAPQSDRDRERIDAGADLAAAREQDRLDEMACADRLHDRLMGRAA